MNPENLYAIHQMKVGNLSTKYTSRCAPIIQSVVLFAVMVVQYDIADSTEILKAE